MTRMDIFDPFSDRIARDIRNSLSTALVAELGGKKKGAVARTAGDWIELEPAPVYRAFIADRQARYRFVLAHMPSDKLNNPRFAAIILWNAGLFFELHELLETIWHTSSGTVRIALKGLIQAAGVYVHVQRGNLGAAQGLARRARSHLAAASVELAFIANADELVRALEKPGQPYPQLIWNEV